MGATRGRAISVMALAASLLLAAVIPAVAQDEYATVDGHPPDTGIRVGPKQRTEKRNARFEFGGSEPGVIFECRLDEKNWKQCDSPHKVTGLRRRAKHVFEVRSVDRAGNPDPTPADRNWYVTRRDKN